MGASPALLLALLAAAPSAAAGPDPLGLCPGLPPAATLRAEMAAVFSRGVPIDAVVQRAASCYEVARNLGGAPSPTRHLELNYQQDLAALLDDAASASYVLRGRPRDFPPDGFKAVTVIAYEQLARSGAPAPRAVVEKLAAKTAPADGIAQLRTRLELLRALEDHPVLRPSRVELASYIQPAQFALAGLEVEARRRGETVEQSRVGSTGNYREARPATARELPWREVYRHIDRKSGERLAGELERRALERMPDLALQKDRVHGCYAAFKEALEQVVPGIRSVAPIGGADDWYLYYNTRSEYLAHARLRLIDPLTVDFFSTRPPEKTGLLGLVITYNAACESTWLYDAAGKTQTPLSGHIEAIVHDPAPLPQDGRRSEFRVCAETCRPLTLAKLGKILDEAAQKKTSCVSVMAFMDETGAPNGDEQLVDVEQGAGYGPERYMPRRVRHSEELDRHREKQDASPLEYAKP